MYVCLRIDLSESIFWKRKNKSCCCLAGASSVLEPWFWTSTSNFQEQKPDRIHFSVSEIFSHSWDHPLDRNSVK